jgi:hypothetical protein
MPGCCDFLQTPGCRLDEWRATWLAIISTIRRYTQPASSQDYSEHLHLLEA